MQVDLLLYYKVNTNYCLVQMARRGYVSKLVKAVSWHAGNLEFSEFRHRKALDYFKTHMLDEDKYEEIFMIFFRILPWHN